MIATPEINPKNPRENIIIGGSFENVQRSLLGASRFPQTFTSAFGKWLDRWEFGTTAGQITGTQQINSPNLLTKFCHQIDVDVAVASPAPGDLSALFTKIEGRNITILDGVGAIVGFHIRTNKSGLMAIAFQNSGVDRSYVTEINVTGDSLWHQYDVFIPAPPFTEGTWDFESLVGLRAYFTLMTGTDFETTQKDEWIGGNFINTPTANNWLDSTSNFIQVAQVQMNVGRHLHTFEPSGGDLSAESLKCMRYFWHIGEHVGLSSMSPHLFAIDTDTLIGWWPTPAPFRVNPITRTDQSTSWTLQNISTPGSLATTINDGQWTSTIVQNIPGVNVRIDVASNNLLSNNAYAIPLSNRRFALDAEL